MRPTCHLYSTDAVCLAPHPSAKKSERAPLSTLLSTADLTEKGLGVSPWPLEAPLHLQLPFRMRLQRTTPWRPRAGAAAAAGGYVP